LLAPAKEINMFAILSQACAAIFVLYPPLILRHRFYRQKPQWWIVISSILLLGWAGWLGATFFHFEHLGTLIDSQENPPKELIDEWASDGGQMTFAVFLGWAIAAAYTLLCYAVFVLAKVTQGFVHKVECMKQNPKAEMKSTGGSMLILFGALWVLAALVVLPARVYGFATILLLVGVIFIAFGKKLRSKLPSIAG
jgi:hypothetical protein